MSEGRRRAMEYVCQQRITLSMGLYIGSVAILLDVGALFLLEPGTAAHVVAIINLPGLIAITALSGYIIRKCAGYT